VIEEGEERAWGPLSEVRVELDADPADEAVDLLRDRIRALRAEVARALDRGASASPGIIVTPLGLRRADALARRLGALGVDPGERRAIPSFPEAASALYVRALDEASLGRALGFEVAWRRLFPEGRAERWALSSLGDLEVLAREKPRLRRAIPGLPVIVELPSFGFRATLHPFHLADPGDHVEESIAVEILLGRGRPSAP
jgi:hypothetical protein